MKKLSNPLIISAIIFVTLFLVGAFISVFLVRNRLDNQFNGTKYELLLRSYQSELLVNNDNFNIFILTIKNPNLENQENISFKLLKDGQTVRELQFSGKNVGDPSDIRLQFAPIPDSGGKNYQVTLNTPQSDKPLSVYTADNGELAYKAYFRSTKKPLALKNFTTAFFKRLISDAFFVGFWVVITALGFVIIRKAN